MITRRGKLGALLGGFAASACASDGSAQATMIGRWGGFLQAGPGLRLILLVQDDKTVKLVSIDQGNAEIPATRVELEQDRLDARFAAINARLTLRYNAQESALVGDFQQGGEVPIRFKRLGATELPERPKAAPFVDYQTEVKNARELTRAPALGGALAALKNGAIVTREAVNGVLVSDQLTPVTAGLKWHIGSVTKSMTATLVARLVEKGKLSWTMTLEEAFGAQAPDMRAAYKAVTLAQLMSGRSGMPTNIGPTDMIAHSVTEQSPTQRRELWVRQSLKLEPEMPAGTGFVYPNNGYVLAGALCERIMGKPYETLMVEEVFGPLGMTTAGFGPPISGNPQGHRKALLGNSLVAVGFDLAADNPPALGPAGRAHMRLIDLAKFGLIHAQGHQGLRNDYLRQETWQYLHTPPERKTPRDNYAFGWVTRPDGTLWHNGSNTYWLAELAFDPKTARSACACANVFTAEAGTSRVLAAGLAAEI